MSFTPLENRVDVDRLAGERHALNQQLDFQRATLLRKLEGLDDEQLRRPMTRSGLTLLGLVKHLTSTEHGWFLNIYAGFPDPAPYGADPSEEFRAGPHDTTQALVDQYLGTCARCRRVVAAGELDDVIRTPSGTSANLRAILLHMIQETARHNGHADTIREQIDGTTGY